MHDFRQLERVAAETLGRGRCRESGSPRDSTAEDTEGAERMILAVAIAGYVVAGARRRANA